VLLFRAQIISSPMACGRKEKGGDERKRGVTRGKGVGGDKEGVVELGEGML
jgi:hypothetical protein